MKVTVLVWLGVMAAGTAAIVWGAELFAEHLAAASARLGLSAFALALLLAGAEPEELATVITASWRGVDGVAFGDVIGANAAITTVALGVGAMVAVDRRVDCPGPRCAAHCRGRTDPDQARTCCVGFATAFELVVLAWSASRRGITDAVVAGVVGSFAYNLTMSLGAGAVEGGNERTDARQYHGRHMLRPLEIAVAQPSCVPGDVAANVVAHCDVVGEADARLVVFPELSITGYVLDSPACKWNPSKRGGSVTSFTKATAAARRCHKPSAPRHAAIECARCSVSAVAMNGPSTFTQYRSQPFQSGKWPRFNGRGRPYEIAGPETVEPARSEQQRGAELVVGLGRREEAVGDVEQPINRHFAEGAPLVGLAGDRTGVGHLDALKRRFTLEKAGPPQLGVLVGVLVEFRGRVGALPHHEIGEDLRFAQRHADDRL
jgi:hypothetical protein